MVKHFVRGSGTSEHAPIYGWTYSTNPITENCWHCGVGRKNPICMFILVYALRTLKLYKKHLARFKTSCQHFGATSIKFLYVITQCVWDGEIVHAQEISHILEKVWISLFVKKKKKKTLGNYKTPDIDIIVSHPCECCFN